jgi:hypothetical protein
MFNRKSSAETFARKVYPHSKSGTVGVTPMRYVPYDEDDAASMPHVGFWEACGDTEYYEGPEE